MRHKYLTAERHPRRRLPRVAPDTFPAGAGFDEFLFLIIRHRRKLTSSPVRASFDAGPRFATRIRLEFGRTRAAQVDPRPRIHYIRTFYIRRERERKRKKKERKKGKEEREGEARCKIRRTVALFRRRARWVLTSDRTVNLCIPR